jgi:hypothetical protein
MSDVNDILDALDKYGHRPGHRLVCGGDGAFAPSAGCCEPECRRLEQSRDAKALYLDLECEAINDRITDMEIGAAGAL